MIVCHCAGVTDAKIRGLVEAGARTLRDVTLLTGAGRCCAPCREEIVDLLDSLAVAPRDRVAAALPIADAPADAA